MDTDNLRTASLYINNQLLSRGLLRNGQNIDFARPDKAVADGGEGLEKTMGRVMSVVNDLILRRDRDATQREALTTTLRTLRAENLRHATDMERLTAKNAEAQRKLGIAESAERAMKEQLKSAEMGNRVLKEDMAKMKVLVAQTRSQCSNEVRKRERTIEGMKKHVGGDGRVRGGGKVVGNREIVVVAGVGEDERENGVMGVGEEGYDLRSETNEFLTELARGLSEENEHLAALARRTVETLRSLSGWEKDHQNPQNNGQQDMVVQTESGYDNLAQETEAVLEHVRTLLTNPSFVPLEEVEIREEEIIRLREGWERMESRWKDAVSMMDGWRKRMARSGQTVNLEELKMGLMLSPLKNKDGSGAGNTQGMTEAKEFGLSMVEEEDGEGDTQADIDAMDDSVEMPDPDLDLGDDLEGDFDDDEMDEDSDSSLFEEEPMQDEDDTETSQDQQEDGEANYTIHTASSMSPDPPPQLSPLKESNLNARAAAPSPPHYSRREGGGSEEERDGFTTIMEENTYDLLQLASPKKKLSSERSTPQSLGKHRGAKKENTPLGRRALGRKEAESDSPDEVVLLSTSFPPPVLAPREQATSTTSARSGSSSPTKSSSSKRPASSASSRLTSQTRDQSTPRNKLAATPSAESRLPRPREQPPMQSPLTMASIAAKLAASEREADAARVRAKLKAARGKAGVAASGLNAAGMGRAAAGRAERRKEDEERRENEERKLMPPPPTPRRNLTNREPDSSTKPTDEPGNASMPNQQENSNVNLNDARSRKRKARDLGLGGKGTGRASRRRSTLSPWELESLILGGAGASPEK
ncbi:related to NAB3 Polyadenylated RNA-binding protein [Rhynchosporium secalis]|uniref:Related to NAB3 Polyadenylated RNA-binding protein n=1 Tax=Rhynchosporium secalis TaxID=38038 RepID=A0A1E1LY00_RHYSE|nr:related to NAB3 Polyadenylated RNA-binding protein [Rhynchosporium secalis]